MKLTKEQKDILDASSTYNRLHINATAGCGKTMTMRLVIEKLLNENKKNKIYYAAFNRAIANEFKTTVSESVNVGTWHSIAYKAQYSNIKDKVTATGKFGGFLSANQLSKHTGFNYKSLAILTSYHFNLAIIDTISNFCHSSDLNISRKHLPISMLSLMEYYKKINSLSTSTSGEIDSVIACSKIIWDKIQDFGNKSFPMSFDHYLKTAQINKIDFSKYASTFIVDEYQDTNPVCYELIKQSNFENVYVVGDKYQQIYCQPPGTKVIVSEKLTSDGFDDIKLVEKDIENLEVGEYVYSYNLNDHLFTKHGRQITRHGSLDFDGDLIKAKTKYSGFESLYTPNHLCVVGVNDNKFKSKHIVYLIKCDDGYRVCYVPNDVKSNTHILSLIKDAECVWILGMYDTPHEAVINEIKFHSTHNIPPMIKSINQDIDDNYNNAEKLLNISGLDIEYPLCTVKTLIDCINDCDKSKIVFVTTACNLNDVMQVLTVNIRNVYYNEPNRQWEDISIERVPYKGKVYSMDVEETHIYCGDGIITHNSFRGVDTFSGELEDSIKLPMTKSFRCSDKIATLANAILETHYDAIDYNMIGAGPGVSDGSTAYISRTNTGVLNLAIDMVENGAIFKCPKVFSVTKVVEKIYSLYCGKKPANFMLKSFKELKEYIEETGDPEYKTAYDFVIKNKGSVPRILDKIKKMDNVKSNITVCNAHTSKGLEYENVFIDDDFKNFAGVVMKNNSGVDLNSIDVKQLSNLNQNEEINLLYVATTRAANGIHYYKELDEYVGSAVLNNILK